MDENDVPCKAEFCNYQVHGNCHLVYHGCPLVEEVEKHKDTLTKLDKGIDEYLCHRRFFHLSMKFGESSSVTVEPCKAHWLVSIYHSYELVKQNWFNSFPEAFNEFQKYSVEALEKVNYDYRNPPKEKKAMTPIHFPTRKKVEQ